MKIIALYATNEDNLFGIYNNTTGKYSLPWHVPEELSYFKEITSGHTVIMGKNTYLSLPNRPLNNRNNIVITSDTTFRDTEFIITAKSLNDAILLAKPFGDPVFIIGGLQLLLEAINMRVCTNIYKSYIPIAHSIAPVYTKLYSPSIPDVYKLSGIRNDRSGKFSIYDYQLIDNSADAIYLQLIRKILDTGVMQKNRTGIDTLTVFGHSMKFDLTNGKIPLLTTKNVPVKSVFEELLFFLKGHTDTNELSSKIWKGNTSKEFLESRGLNYKEGLIGPLYGYQWRYFNAKYDANTGKPVEEGIDQLANILYLLRNDPMSRRIMMTAYNPAQSKECVLDPCHVFVQFNVTEADITDTDRRPWLSSQMYQRSADTCLGVPFNIASYSLLTTMLAKVMDMRPKEFIHVSGNAHIYKDHIEPVKTQFNNPIGPDATVEVYVQVAGTDLERLLAIKLEDIVVDYIPGPLLKLKMAI